jgi:hypothetical protein
MIVLIALIYLKMFLYEVRLLYAIGLGDFQMKMEQSGSAYFIVFYFPNLFLNVHESSENLELIVLFLG